MLRRLRLTWDCLATATLIIYPKQSSMSHGLFLINNALFLICLLFQAKLRYDRLSGLTNLIPDPLTASCPNRAASQRDVIANGAGRLVIAFSDNFDMVVRLLHIVRV